MNKTEVVELLGNPDVVLPRLAGMVSDAWLCSTCCKVHRSAAPIRPPSPCECGGVFFEKHEDAPR